MNMLKGIRTNECFCLSCFLSAQHCSDFWCMLMVCDMSSCCAISNLFMTEDTKSGSLPSRSLSLTDFASLMSQGIFQFHIDVGSEPGA